MQATFLMEMSFEYCYALEENTENFNLVIHLAFLSMYHHPIFKRYILSNYPEFYRITLFLET